MAVKTYKKGSTAKLSTNFSVHEFACNGSGCCSEVLIDTDLVSILQKIRTHFGKAVNISSAYRCPTHNKKIGGVSASQHTKGKAADIKVDGVKPAEVAKYAESIGVKGIGLYETAKDGYFVHVDTRATKSYWYGQAQAKRTTFGGAPTTPAKKPASKYSVGDYVVNASLLNVRTGPGTNYSIKRHAQLSANARAEVKRIAGYAANGYVKGMVCTVSEVKGDWGRTPSGWISLDHCTKRK